jgi:plastocyanin
LNDPNSLSNFTTSPALWTVALILRSFLTIPASPMRVFTSFSVIFETFSGENAAKAFRKFGHFFSTMVQFNPAVNRLLLILSKYSASLFGGATFHPGGMRRRAVARLEKRFRAPPVAALPDPSPGRPTFDIWGRRTRACCAMSNFQGGRSGHARRPGLGTTIVAAIVVVVLVVAVGGYLVLSSTSKGSSTQSVTVSTSRTTPSTTTSVSSTSNASGALFPFEFSLEQASQALVSPGGYSYVVVLTISHSAGSGGEFVALNSTSPAGITVEFSPSSPVALKPGADANVTVDVLAASNATLGNDTIGVQGVAGPYSQSASFNLMVVQYSVIMSPSTYLSSSIFFPSVLNVTVGSTVYWQNLDGPASVCGEAAPPGTGYHNVVFTTLPAADSPTIEQFEIYSYTFTTPGSYFYYSSLDTDHSMNGTINVLAQGGGGIGMVPKIPTFSYFKNQNLTVASTPQSTRNGSFSPAQLVPPILAGMASVGMVLSGALLPLASGYLSEAGLGVLGGAGVLSLAIAVSMLARNRRDP